MIQPVHAQLAVDSVTQAEPHAIGIGTGMNPQDLLRLKLSLGYGHICQNDGHEYNLEMNSAEYLIRDRAMFFDYPVCSVFRPDAPSAAHESQLTTWQMKFHRSGQKRVALEEIQNALRAKQVSQTMIEDVNSVADEMFTNAVYNAPFVDPKTNVNPGISRSAAEVALDPGKFGHMFLVHSGNRLLIGCRDPYGSLNLNSYLAKIKITYDQGAAATMNFGPGGAGLGSYIIFNSGCSLYFGVWPGQASVICCVLPLGMSNRKRAVLSKHLHCIQP